MIPWQAKPHRYSIQEIRSKYRRCLRIVFAVDHVIVDIICWHQRRHEGVLAIR